MFRTLVITFLSFFAAKAVSDVVTSTTPQQLLDSAKQGLSQVVLDVRTPEEYAAGHIPNAINIPYDELPQRLTELSKDASVVVYCRKGGRARIAEKTLVDAGFSDVSDLEGHWTSWQSSNLPSEKP